MFDASFLGFYATILLTPLVTALLLIANKLFLEEKLGYWQRQVLFGVAFGLVAIAQTEFATPFHDALLNVRDSAPICAGLIFGGPSGIIAGVIGGLERWFAVYWGAGEFTRLACTLGTIIAGIYAALFHKFIFEKKTPSFFYACTIGLVAEVIHLVLVMLTNSDQVEKASTVISALTAPILIGVTVSVGLSVLVARIVAKDPLVSVEKVHGIARSIQAWILCVSAVCFIVLVAALGVFQSHVLRTDVGSELQTNLQAAQRNVLDSLDKDLLETATDAAASLGAIDRATNARCTAVADSMEVEELNAVNRDGIIVASNLKGNVGFDMGSTTETAEFLALLDGTDELTQTERASATDSKQLFKYVGVSADGGFYEMGIDYSHLVDELGEQVEDSTRNTVIGKTGGVAIASADNVALSIPSSLAQNQGEIESLIAAFSDDDALKISTAYIGDTEMYCMYGTYAGFRSVALYPVSEATFTLSVISIATIFLEIIVLSTLLFFIYIAVNKVVIRNIYRINEGLGRIADGELDTVIDVHEYKEFDKLSNDVNSTVDVLKGYIAQESERVKEELEYAHAIQLNTIPSTFPAFPGRHEFDLHANIELAKEVGGDFYDYCLVDDDHLMLLIGDVAGKGIPAALFMMTAKTMLQGLAKNKLTPAEVLASANNLLSQDNESSMFVTVWIAIVELSTGHTVFANAGHNRPALCRANGEYELIDQLVDMSAGFIGGVGYRNQEIDLQPGDTLFLYTDGVTEANDTQGTRFEEPRLLDALNSCAGESARAVCSAVTREVARFADGAVQFDDITMLAFTYFGPGMQAGAQGAGNMTHALAASTPTATLTNTLTVDARIENIPVVTNAMNVLLEESRFPATARIQAGIAIDEIVANIAHYAYPQGDGLLTVHLSAEELGDSKKLTMSFIDQGVPFNPLEHQGEDMSVSPTERKPGGMGIAIVKDLMEDVRYKYLDGSNVLTIEKSFPVDSPADSPVD